MVQTQHFQEFALVDLLVMALPGMTPEINRYAEAKRDVDCLPSEEFRNIGLLLAS